MLRNKKKTNKKLLALITQNSATEILEGTTCSTGGHSGVREYIQAFKYLIKIV